MESKADAFLAALSAGPAGPSPILAAASQPDLRSLLSVLPRKRQAPLAARLLINVRALAPAPQDESARRAAATIVGHCLRDKKAPTPPELRDVAIELGREVTGMASAIGKNAVVKVAEVFWEDGREGREDAIVGPAEVLLERSLAVESGGVSSAEDVKRVFGLRGVFCGADAVVGEVEKPQALVLRCVTSPHYLRLGDGKRFVAWVLASEELGEKAHAGLLGLLPLARKSQAVAIGAIYVLAWKYAGINGQELFAERAQDVLKKALHVRVEPLATNLRTVLSSFHANKKLTGMDRMLHIAYKPVLFRCVPAANPFVRRNAVTILADAFPIHDPDMSNAELEATLEDQTAKMFMLLEDPVPLVRVAAVEGQCRVLGLLWDIVPPATAKKMVHVMTGVLAYDMSSAIVRATVCDGLRFMLQNHQTHPLLSVALPRLANVIHDKIERVRVSFLNLLLELKAKRIVSARYFDVVPLEDILQRLPVDSPAVTTKVMQLLVSSFFPLERKNKTRAEIAESQIRACLEMIRQDIASAEKFYQNVSMFIPPGPLVEFCLRLSSIAMESTSAPVQGKKAKSTAKETSVSKSDDPGRKHKRSSRVSDKAKGGENLGPKPASGSHEAVDRRTQLLGIVANILQGISPSLVKPVNEELMKVIVDIFGGDSLKSMLIPGRNSLETRLTCLKIAGCVPAKEILPVVSMWKEQFESLVESLSNTACSADDVAWVSGALGCGVCWGEVNYLASVVSGWADAAFSGRRAVLAGKEATKRFRRSQSNDVSSESDRVRMGAIRALTIIATSLVESEDTRNAFQRVVDENQARDEDRTADKCLPPAHQLVSAVRRGSIASLDAFLEDGASEQNKHRDLEVAVLDCLRASLRLSVTFSETVSDKVYGHAELVSRSQLDVLEVIQWATGSNVLSASYLRSRDFGDALISLVMSAACDSAALGKLPVSLGALYLTDFVEAVTASKTFDDDTSTGKTYGGLRFGLDSLTTSYHLKVQMCLATATTDSATHMAKQSVPAPRVGQDQVQALLSSSLRVLDRCHFSTRMAGSESVVSRVAEFLLFMRHYEADGAGSSNAVLEAVTEAVQPSKETATSNENSDASPGHSALTNLLALSLVKLTLKPPRGVPKSCGFDLATRLLRGLEEKSAAAMAFLAKGLADGILDAFHDSVVVPDEVLTLCTELKWAFARVKENQNIRSQTLRDSLPSLEQSLAELKTSPNAESSGAGPEHSRLNEMANARPVHSY